MRVPSSRPSRRARRHDERRARGFSLLELSLAIVLAGALAIGSLKTQQFQRRIDAGRHVGEALALLRDGALQYVRDHHRTLAELPRHRECAKGRLYLPPAPAMAPPSGCATVIQGHRLDNAFQPTIEDLRALGYVHSDMPLTLPHGDTVIDAATGHAEPPRWAVLVQCVVCEPPPGRAPTFSVMLFNTQPFYAKSALPFGVGAQFEAMRRAVGPDGLLSMPGGSLKAAYILHGPLGPIANPLRTCRDDEGVPGVLATYRLVHGAPESATAASIQAVTSTTLDGQEPSSAASLDEASGPASRRPGQPCDPHDPAAPPSSGRIALYDDGIDVHVVACLQRAGHSGSVWTRTR